MNPTTPTQWMEVGNQRAADAIAIHSMREHSVGSFYLVGYAIECSLKAYLLARGTPVPRHGRAGHDLRELWRASQLRLQDLNDGDGCKAFYLFSWSTNYRYSLVFQCAHSKNTLIKRAQELTGWIQTLVRRRLRR
jgi:HEPN domain